MAGKKKSSIYIKPSKRGSLRKATKTKKGSNIPASKLRIKRSDSKAMRKKKQFAINKPGKRKKLVNMATVPEKLRYYKSIMVLKI